MNLGISLDLKVRLMLCVLILAMTVIHTYCVPVQPLSKPAGKQTLASA